MEKLPIVKHEKISPKYSKKKPVKVVYISNPMKVKTTPSEFRAVVQQLTGKYANNSQPHEFATNAFKDDLKEEASRAVQSSKFSYADFVITPQMLEGFSPM
ncbi:sigma factor binding protein 1, chloroplastic-like protein [Tanacetum coccineum]